MKQIISIFIFTIITFYTNAQISIQQIGSTEIIDVLSIQNANPTFRNMANIQQLGNNNTASINQSATNEFADPNQAQLFQDGSQNMADITQKGGNNQLLTYQLGYLSTKFDQSNTVPVLETLTSYFPLINYVFGDLSTAENNTVICSQEGSSNGLLTLQVGTDNYISATQTGQNNYLVATQIGQSNHLVDFKQENQSSSEFLLESVTQLGRNNLIEFSGTINGQIYGNSYAQSGDNLAIKLNTSLISSIGGMNITQTGHDMNVVIDQSYFSFPMK